MMTNEEVHILARTLNQHFHEHGQLRQTVAKMEAEIDRLTKIAGEHATLREQHAIVTAERDALGGTELARKQQRDKRKAEAARAKYNAEQALLEIAEMEKSEAK